MSNVVASARKCCTSSLRRRSVTSKVTLTTPVTVPSSSTKGESTACTTAVDPSLRRTAMSVSDGSPAAMRAAMCARVASSTGLAARSSARRPTSSSRDQPYSCSAWLLHATTRPCRSVNTTATRRRSSVSASNVASCLICCPPPLPHELGTSGYRGGRQTFMEYRQLGRSDLKVSEISVGSWLTYGVGVDADAARACVEKAFDVGINFIDTANVYGRGAAEEFLGETLAGMERSSYVLATKVYFAMSRKD